MIIQNIHKPPTPSAAVWLAPLPRHEENNHCAYATQPLADSGFVPKRVLGFDPSLGRGFVYSTDQTQQGRPEFLFLDTPGDPDLQLLCSLIITKHSNNSSAISSQDDVSFVEEEIERHLTMSFVTRFVNPSCPGDFPLKRLLEDVYFEGRSLTHGVVVMVPTMDHRRNMAADDDATKTPTSGLATLWGSGGYDFPAKVTKESLDMWIELVCIDYYSASAF